MRLSSLATLDVRLPSGEMAFSPSLLSLLRLSPGSQPASFEQWHELGHPGDHLETQGLLQALYESDRTALSLTRRVYCGDGIYRPLRLDACILRASDGAPLRLMGTETDLTPQRQSERRTVAWRSLNQELQGRLGEQKDEIARLGELLAEADSERTDAISRLASLEALLDALPVPFCVRRQTSVRLLGASMQALASRDSGLSAWLETAKEGERRNAEDHWGRTKTFQVSASPLPGSEGELLALFDVSEGAEAERENLILRRRLQRAALRLAVEEPFPIPESPAFSLAEPLPADAPYAESAQNALTALLGQALAALAGNAAAPSLSSRRAQLEALAQSAGRVELTAGVLGITSSGKSSLINAMMGERLLPEETRATTNVTVLCRKGGIRAVDVLYEDGRTERLSGTELTLQRLGELTTERQNPGNTRGVARIEWSSPGAALPQGLALVDTPGLDACELPRHSELVLRRILPTLDLVLYVSSIRSPIKAVDLELTQTVLEADQRMILLLTQIDLERDDTEGGRVILSRGQKLAVCLRELREGVARARSDCPIIPVSSKLALRHFYDRDSTEWQASNFDPLLRQTAQFREHLIRHGVSLRGKRAATLLRRTLEDLEASLRETNGAEPGSAILRSASRIRELRDAQRWVSAEISSVRNEWRRELASQPILDRFRREAEAVQTPDGLHKLYLRWGGEWAELLNRMTERMDRAKAFCGEMLSRHGLVPSGRLDPLPGIRTELPDLDRYIHHQSREVRTRGWFQGLSFWPEHKRIVHQVLDREHLMREWNALLTDRLGILESHLNWWENRMRESVCDPLYEELSREEQALEDTKRARTERALSQSALRETMATLRTVERDLQRLLENVGALPLQDGGPLPPIPLPVPEEEADEGGEDFFAPIFQAIAEQAIQTRFLSLPALRRRRRIVLLGLRRHDSLRLLSRLAHDAALTDVPRTPDGREIGEGEWIFCGRVPPALPHALLKTPSSALDELDLLVAPSDVFRGAAMREIDWNDLFGEWLPVVHLDIARVDSGLSDLARAPYAPALAGVPEWIAASAHGGLFATRLPDLVLDVPDRMTAFTRMRRFRGRMDWFVHENYDPRYTDFIALGRQTGADSSDEDLETLISLWRESGLDFAPPLTEHRLRLALREIRERLRADSSRLLDSEEAIAPTHPEDRKGER